MKTLHLNLKKQWFDMVESFQKWEEYREMSDYWVRRLVSFDDEVDGYVLDEFIGDLKNPFDRHNGPQDCMLYFGASFREFDAVIMKNGYARGGKPAPSFGRRINAISVGVGHPAWGAEPGKYYFVIDMGLLHAPCLGCAWWAGNCHRNSREALLCMWDDKSRYPLFVRKGKTREEMEAS